MNPLSKDEALRLIERFCTKVDLMPVNGSLYFHFFPAVTREEAYRFGLSLMAAYRNMQEGLSLGGLSVVAADPGSLVHQRVPDLAPDETTVCLRVFPPKQPLVPPRGSLVEVNRESPEAAAARLVWNALQEDLDAYRRLRPLIGPRRSLDSLFGKPPVRKSFRLALTRT